MLSVALKGQNNMTKFKIIDWAGNDKSDYYGHFDSFEDAWGRLYQEFEGLPEDEFNETMGEFYVEEIN